MEYSKEKNDAFKASYPSGSDIPMDLWNGIAEAVEKVCAADALHSPAAPYLTGFQPVLATGFSELVLDMLRARDIMENDFYTAANLSRQVFNSIINKPNYKPTKSTALACAIGLRLSLEDADTLLRSAGYSFSQSNYTDIIVAYSLKNGYYDIIVINQIIYAYNEKPLGSF